MIFSKWLRALSSGSFVSLKYFIMRFVFLSSLIFIVFFVHSQPVIKSFYNKVPNSYNFLVHIPSFYNDTSGQVPLIIFLHGRSLSGTDLNRVKKYGVLDAVIRRKVNPNALVVAPQCPKTESWDPDKILKLVYWAKKKYRIDTNRIYVVGMSLGGYGTMDFAGKYANEITAAIALCGGGKEKYAENLSTIPFWIIHGNADRAVPVSQSKKMETAIKNSGPAPFLKTDYLDGLDHGDLADVFYMQKMYDWLHQFDKSDSSKSMINNYNITLADFRPRPMAGRIQPHIALIDSAESDTLNSTPDINLAYSPNQNLELVSPVEKPAIVEERTIHIVSKGDTLYALSKKYHVSISEICRNNQITENTILQIGQKLKI